MSVPAAYLAVIVIWSTTPLAVKWSGEPGFLFGALGRMTLAALFCLALLLMLRVELPWHRTARRTYAAATIAIYGAMLCVYWASQRVPSGLIAVIFGLTPLLTALFARWLLNERDLTRARLAGMALGIIGLAVIFGGGSQLGENAVHGIFVLLVGVIVNAMSMVLVKRTNGALAPIAVTTGALLYAVPLFFLTWLMFDGHMPKAISTQATWSILYLGVVASAFGFTLFFYLLKHTPATGVALLTLVSPVTALWLGSVIDHEQVPGEVWTGTGLVLAGLAVNQWGPAIADRLGVTR